MRGTHGFARSARAVALGAAAPGDYLVTPAVPLFPFPGIQTAADPNRRALFPGALKLALALAGLVWGLRRAETRRFAGFLLATGAVAVALSLLPGWGGMRGTHAWLRDLVPGLSQIRSFWRASMLMQVATVLLAAMGIQALADATRRLASPRARRTADALAIGIALAASVELWPLAPGALRRRPRARPGAPGSTGSTSTCRRARPWSTCRCPPARPSPTTRRRRARCCSRPRTGGRS